MRKITQTFNNWLSISGFILVFNSLILMLFFQIFILLYGNLTSYIDFYLYVVIPILLIIGLIMIPAGMYLRLRKERKLHQADMSLPVIDFNEKPDRIIVLKILVITLLFLAASGLGSYKVYEYTGTAEFCGELCHRAMQPEYATYLNSSHAKVPCMGCHSGAGSGWVVQSRLAILGMAYSYLTNTYERPIPHISAAMRPDRETCENCHWPQKFYTRKLINHEYYLTDSSNTAWSISLLLKVGPKNTAHGLKEGIHWHINPDVKIEYKSDALHQETIPWVRYTNLKTGVVKTYTNGREKAVSTNKDHLFTMDCMDCHNRPSHLFLSASTYIDHALCAGTLDKGIPYIKLAAMKALSQKYPTVPAADSGISETIQQFYTSTHADTWKKYGRQINKAIPVILAEYHKNTFEDMSAGAEAYPNHLGHLESKGCYRCHSGNHKTETGEVISADCNLCHTIFEQGTAGNLAFTDLNKTLEFIHPVALKSGKDVSLCYECHGELFQ